MKKFVFIIISMVLTLSFSQKLLAQVPDLGQSDEPVEISADNLTVLQKDERAVFQGNVIAIQGDITLKSDKMVVYYNSKKGKSSDKGQAMSGDAVSKIDVEGNVILTSQKETAKGDRGTYDVDRSLIILKGNVLLSQGTNLVKGNELVYNLDTGKTKMSSEPGAKGGRVKGMFIPNEKN